MLEEELARRREYYKKNAEKIRMQRRENYRINREKILAQKRKRYWERREEMLPYKREWRQKHLETERAKEYNEYLEIRQDPIRWAHRKKIRRDWRIKKKIEFITALGGGCNECGYNKCIAALDLHHKDPTKKLGKNWDFIRPGITPDAFILLCSNCHRELHWTERHPDLTLWPKFEKKEENKK